MVDNPKIVVLSGDLGWAMWDYVRRDFPSRFINCGAAEQSMLNIACGMSVCGIIPVVYSITPFLIFRGMETIRLYIAGENMNVKMIGSGRDRDYAHDGPSHDATGIEKTLDLYPQIKQFYPPDPQSVDQAVTTMLNTTNPCFLSLKR